MKASRIIKSLTLIIILLVCCLLLSGVFFIASWLHTFSAFTDKTLVAEVTISEQLEDENGQYTNVVYKPVMQTSALTLNFDPNAEIESTNEIQEFKIYADTVHIGGPILKFRDGLVLLKFDQIFKVTQLFGRYNFDIELENSRTQPASFELNGGNDDLWRSIHDNILDFPYNVFFEVSQIDVPGVSVSRFERNYNLYVTNLGFIWIPKEFDNQ